MFSTFYHKICSLLLTLAWLSIPAQAITDTITSPQGDVVIIDYKFTLDHDSGKATITFNGARIKLGNNSKKYQKLQTEGKLKVLFVDGHNYEKGIKVSQEKNSGIDISPITIPAGWSYKSSNNRSTVFVLNDTGKPALVLNAGQSKKTLEIPIYLAEHSHKNGIILLQDEETTYKVFRECGPLKIDLPVSTQKFSQTSTTTVASRNEKKVVLENETIDVKNDDSELRNLQTQQKINDLRTRLMSCTTLAEVDNLQAEINQLDGSTSTELRDAIESLKKDWRQRRDEFVKRDEETKRNDTYVIEKLEQYKCRLDSCKSTSEIENLLNEYNSLSQSYSSKVSPTVNEQIQNFNEVISDKKEEIRKKEEKLKWIKRIIIAICALLGGLGFHKLQNIRNAKNLKGLEDMQKKMVQRAKNEAKRRTRSYTQNKTRQVIGQTKNKGRQVAQSKAQEVAERVRGQKPSSSATPTNDSSRANEGNNHPPIGRFSSKRNQLGRRPKSGKNGDITI